MGKKIESLTHLKLEDSFIQINYSDGIRIIDHIGRLISHFRDKHSEAFFEGIPGGVSIKNFDKYLVNLKIDPTGIWCQHNSTIDISKANLILKPYIDLLKANFEIVAINRIGFRNYYLYETTHLGQINEIKKRLSIIPEMEITSSGFKSTDEGIDIVLNVFLLVGNDDPNKYAIRFDLDTFIRKDIKVSEYDKEFMKLIDYRNRKMLSLVNSIL